MDKSFDNKVAIVTGAASGLGAAIARRLAERGAAVVVADIDESGAQAVVGDIEASDGRATSFAVDVTDAGRVEAMVAHAEHTFGELHLAVNNAGIGGPTERTGGYPLEGWRTVIEVNLTSVFLSMRYEIPALLRSGGGAIVNMASILGSVGFASAPAYVAAKHGVVGLTKAAAIDHAGDHIRINAVGPGFIDTPLLSESLSAAALEHIAALHPMGRLGKADEVADLTCFLLSDAASFITGSYHVVDGGYVAR